MKKYKKTMKKFGFIIGVNGFPIDVQETTEKKALLKFIDKYYKRLEDENFIFSCLGEMVK